MEQMKLIKYGIRNLEQNECNRTKKKFNFYFNILMNPFDIFFLTDISAKLME